MSKDHFTSRLNGFFLGSFLVFWIEPSSFRMRSGGKEESGSTASQHTLADQAKAPARVLQRLPGTHG
jgi:hypothetical protein